MARPTGETESDVFRLDFDRRLMLQFRGSAVTCDAGLLAYRELDDALGLTEMAGETLADARTGRNGRHALVGLLRQSVFGRLAGYEDVNHAERLRHDPTMRWIVGGKAAHSNAASPSQMGRFETQWLVAPANFSSLADLSGQWIELVHGRRPPRGIVLVSPHACNTGADQGLALTSLKEKLIKIGAKVVSHGRYVVFQMAEVAIPRQMFQEILRLIAELRPQPPPAPA
jgi:hypothetical protein